MLSRRSSTTRELVAQVVAARSDACPVVLLHPGSMPNTGYAGLAAALAPDTAVHMVNLEVLPEFAAPGPDGTYDHTSVSALAEQIVSELRGAGLTTGRWCLAGWCFGGVVGLEIIQLLASDELPRGLLAMDSVAPVPEQVWMENIDDSLLIPMFAKSLGAKRDVDIPVDGLGEADNEEGLRLVLARAIAHGALGSYTTLPGIRKLFQAYQQRLSRADRLTQRYSSRPVPVPMVLVRPEREPLNGSYRPGWAELARDLTVLACPGDHYTMVTEPAAVSIIAAAVRTLLATDAMGAAGGSLVAAPGSGGTGPHSNQRSPLRKA